MMQQTGKIIIAIIIATVIVGGVIYFLQQKNNIAQNAPSTVGPKQSPAIQEQPIQSVKTSLELMKEVLVKNNPDIIDGTYYEPENYKIFEEIKSPYSEKSIVLFGLDFEKTQDCCLRPTGIFINNQGSCVDKYDILGGAGGYHSYLENAKWQNDKIISYDAVFLSEGGKNEIAQRSIVVN